MNRYKSILCQEEPYLLELVRYIHLNPLRAGVVASLDELESYRYSGHSHLLGRHAEPWQVTDDILARFGKRLNAARENYAAFVAEGAARGRRPELTGGGLVRSAGGWQQLSSLRQVDAHLKSDERILGDSEFVETVLKEAEERLEAASVYRLQGLDLEWVAQMVANLLQVDAGEVWAPGKQPVRVQARSLLCYWAVREMGMSATAVASRLNLTQPSVSRAVQRGEQIAAENGWQLRELMNA